MTPMKLTRKIKLALRLPILSVYYYAIVFAVYRYSLRYLQYRMYIE
jgi:hypothetical protein